MRILRPLVLLSCALGLGGCVFVFPSSNNNTSSGDAGTGPAPRPSCDGSPSPAPGFPAVGGAGCSAHFQYTTRRNGATISYESITERGTRPVPKRGGYDLFAEDSSHVRQPDLYLPSLAPGTYATATRCVDPPDVEAEIVHEDTTGTLRYYGWDYFGGNGRIEVAGSDGQTVWGRFSGKLCEVDDWCLDVDGTFSAVIEATPSGAADRSTLCGEQAVVIPGFPSLDGFCGPAVFDYAEVKEDGGCWMGRSEHDAFRGARPRPSGGWDVAITRTLKSPSLHVTVADVAPGVYRASDGRASIARAQDDKSWFARGAHGEATVEIVGNDGEKVWGRYTTKVCSCLPAPPMGPCVVDASHCRTIAGRVSARLESTPSDLP